MKQALQQHVKWLRTALMVLILALTGARAYAVESDDINAAILAEGSIPVTWTHDPDQPWEIGADGTSVTVTDFYNKETRTLTISFTSAYPVYLYFDKKQSSVNFSCLVDGEAVTAQSSYVEVKHIPAGTHTVDITATGNSSNYTGVFTINNIRVMAYRELETACLKEGSLPLTFENDPEHPWLTENGYIRNVTYGDGGKTKISTTFTIDTPSIFSFEYTTNNSYQYTKLNSYVDGEILKSGYSSGWTYQSIVLYPGTHTIELERVNTSGSVYDISIRNVRLDQTWLLVTLNNPGELGTRLLQALGDKNLQDAELVKIKGAMNSDDWTTIGQLTGIHAVDFTETEITDIPANAFDGKSHLSTVMLPEGLKTIDSYAFRKTDFHTVTIPASVERINSGCWYESTIRHITFDEGSNLQYIGYQAFYRTPLTEFIMPDSVTELGLRVGYSASETFYYCESLTKLHLSDGLTTIPERMALYTSSLKDLKLPSHCETIGSSAFYESGIEEVVLPETLTTIGSSAFYKTQLRAITIPESVSSLGSSVFESCKSLREVTLNSRCRDMNRTFYGCTAVERIVLPSATPPTIQYDPFYNLNKSQAVLIVPDFAFESFRTDTYWYQFTNTRIGNEASIRDSWGILGNLTLNSTHLMQAEPAVQIYEGGVLQIEEDTPQKFGAFEYNTSETKPGVMLSRSNSATAESLETKFYVGTASKWYFFAPVCDVAVSDVRYPATDAWVIRRYDGARRASEDSSSGNWVNVAATDTLHRGQGYIIQANAAGWLHMPVPAERMAPFFGSEAVTLALEENPCGTAANAGWNFVANPYPSYYDIYYIDMQAPITVWTGSTYRAYSLNDGDRGDDTYVLRPMQPFFVQKDEAELTAGMPLTGRQTNTAIDRTRAPRRAPAFEGETRHMLNLELWDDTGRYDGAEATEASDYTRIVLNETASAGYETRRDASKFMSVDAGCPQIFSLGEESHPMAINERPYIDGNVGLGVYLPAASGRYRISAVRADRQAWLYDAVTGTEHDLTQGDYTFTPSKSGTDTSRFTVRFAPSSGVAGTGDDIPVTVKGHKGYIGVTAPEGSGVAVYGIDGALHASVDLTGTSGEVALPAGIYVVKVAGRAFKTTVK